MFTGIIEAAVEVAAFEPHQGSSGTGARLWLPNPDLPDWEVSMGQSIAVCGVCLTVASLEDGRMAFDLSKETLDRTWFGGLEAAQGAGRRVNLERAMKLGDRLDGHMVSGHVDGVGEITAVDDVGDGGREIGFRVPGALERYLVDKGSVTLDGTSLTVVEPHRGEFRVAMIPLTLEITAFGASRAGDPVNVEADLVGKWVERLGQGA